MTFDDEGTTMVETVSGAEAETNNGRPSELGPRKGWSKLPLPALASAVLALGLVIFWGIRSRVEAETQLQISTSQAAIPSVDVIHPRQGAPSREIVLPGTMQAFTDTPIYARTNGYLTK